MELRTAETSVESVRAFEPIPKELDPVKMPNSSLREYGLPERPDPDKQPREYARWLRHAKAQRIVPDLVKTNVQHGPLLQRPTDSPETSQNWSGIVIVDPANPFAQHTRIYADFTVPNILPPAPAPQTYCSAWVGIDGYGSGDVLQAGVQIVDNGGNIQAYFWTEWYPENEVQVTNLAVKPGDSVGIVLTFDNPGGGGAVLTNNTSNQSVGFSISPPAGVALTGNCIEWIVERPGINGQYSTLAPYGSVVMQNCDANGGADLIYWPGQAPTGTIDTFTMINTNGQTISQASLGPPDQYNGKEEYDNIVFVYNINYEPTTT